MKVLKPNVSPDDPILNLRVDNYGQRYRDLDENFFMDSLGVPNAAPISAGRGLGIAHSLQERVRSLPKLTDSSPWWLKTGKNKYIQLKF
jgi:hypothetical protein